MEDEIARIRVLREAERLFSSRGVRAVRMEDVRDECKVPLRQLYRLYPSKDDLAVACLRAREDAQRERLQRYLAGELDPRRRLLLVFDFLDEWLTSPSFSGCPWINLYGEARQSAPGLAREAQEQKRLYGAYLSGMASDAGLADEIARAIVALAEGAIVCASLHEDHAAARHARAAVNVLLDHAAAPSA